MIGATQNQDIEQPHEAAGEPGVGTISLLLPTRGRATLCQRFFDSVATTTRRLDALEIILYVDDDDVDSHHLDHPDLDIKRIIGPRLSMGDYNSQCLQRSIGNIIILVNDDMVIRTGGWDEKVRAVDDIYTDRLYLAYGNDLFKGRKLCTFPILSRHTCDLLVDPYPTNYRGAFIDYHLLDIFNRLKRRGFDRIHYLDNVVFEHLHYRTGKAEKDETYSSRGRLADDPTFIALADFRRQETDRLQLALTGQPLPAFTPPTASERIPPNVFAALWSYTRTFFFDSDLPFGWRSWLTVWFFGRYLAARGWLGPFFDRS